jgi:hypothetical protein
MIWIIIITTVRRLLAAKYQFGTSAAHSFRPTNRPVVGFGKRFVVMIIIGCWCVANDALCCYFMFLVACFVDGQSDATVDQEEAAAVVDASLATILTQSIHHDACTQQIGHDIICQ